MKLLKYMIMILFCSFFIFVCSEDFSSSGNECTSSEECAAGLVCFQGSCYEGGGTDGVDILVFTDEGVFDAGSVGMDVFVVLSDPGFVSDLFLDNDLLFVDKVNFADGTMIDIFFKIIMIFSWSVKNVGKDFVELWDVNGVIFEGVFV